MPRMADPITKVVPIPQPWGLPYLGHIAEFRSEDSMQDLDRLFDMHGDIFRLRFPGIGSCVFIGTHKLVNEVFDESRFKKSIQADLGEIRKVVNDGLFTADAKEENWGLAHRILLPAFGPAAIRNMFDEMYDVLSQMALKWARHGPNSPIPCSDHFTRLTLDTLALCSMGYRFNSFYREELHEFVQSMGDSLVEFGNRSARPKWANPLFFSAGRKLSKDISLMRKVSQKLMESRKADPDSTNKKDLLTAMLDGVDPKTGAKLSDESIINNLITFLVAGHETTSGTLSFAFYSILKNPEVYRKAQQEVDEIMGRDRVTVDKLFKLKYIPAILRETLRQCSPIPGIIVEPLEETMLAGKYPVKKAEPIVVAFSRTHFDPTVYGNDARQFKPERMLDENFERLEKEFPNCWKPFGNGMRACIGRPFAWQEMLLAISVLLQNFNFYQQDPSYVLKISETLTIKPKDFFIRASLRHGMTALDLEHRLSGNIEEKRITESTLRSLSTTANESTVAKQINIYFGSNSGTCEALARRLALNAPAHGFRASIVEALDLAKDKITSKDPIVILTASYEGRPPDNAAHFVDWLENTSDELGRDVSFAVFGVGNSEWRQTFHRIPKLVDDRLSKRGATRLVPLGLTDVAKNNPFLDFESWEDDILWPTLAAKFTSLDPNATSDTIDMHVGVSAPRCSTLRQNVVEAVVIMERVMTTPEMPLKKHIEIKLPEHLSYEAGDYLAVLPINPSHIVSRVFRRFKLLRDANITIRGNEAALLPMQGPTSAWEVFSSYVELSAPATRKNILSIAMHAVDNATKATLQSLATDANHPSGSKKKVLSALDILEQYPLVEMPIGIFLSMLPPIRTRQYSISSSPLWNPHMVSLTYSVLERPSVSGDGKYIGVATSYLASLKPDDRIHVSVRRSHTPFHPPRDPRSVPIICIAAGAGIAPFRGFIQQRSIQIKAMKTLAPALVIYGCRDINDDLYREEFDTWEAEGVVQVRRAYSRQECNTNGCKYVQDRIREQKKLVMDMWNDGAKLFVCGGREVGNAVERSFVELLSEFYNLEQAAASETLDRIRGERFIVDIFS